MCVRSKCLKKIPLNPSPRVGGARVDVCGQNICYGVATFPILFNYKIQHDHVLKKKNLDLLTPSHGQAGGGGWGVVAVKIVVTILRHI